MPGRDGIDEGPSDEDLAEFGDDAPAGTVRCPHCVADVYEDAVRCQACGEYVKPRAGGRRSAWYVAAVIAAAAALTAWVVLGWL